MQESSIERLLASAAAAAAAGPNHGTPLGLPRAPEQLSACAQRSECCRINQFACRLVGHVGCACSVCAERRALEEAANALRDVVCTTRGARAFPGGGAAAALLAVAMAVTVRNSSR